MKPWHRGRIIHAAAALTVASSGCAAGLEPGNVGGGGPGSSTTTGGPSTTGGTGGASGSSSSTTSSSSSSTTSSSTSSSSTSSSTSSSSSTGSTSSGGPLSCMMGYCNLGNGGYAFGYSDSQNKPPETPGTSTATLSTTGLCISGSVMQVMAMDFTDDWGCGIGYNLSQTMGTNTPVNAYQLSGTGVTVSTSAVPSCTTARVVLDQNGAQSYCAALTPGVEIPWATFNTACWNGSGTALSGPPASQAIKVQFVSSTTQACPFTDFCITDISL